MTKFELQESLAEALKRSNVLIRRVDGTIEYWSKGCERLYGWSEAEAVGRRSFELLKTKFPQPLELIEKELLAKGSWQGVVTQQHKDGRSLLISTDFTFLPSEKSAPLLVVSTHNDITSRLEMERELDATNQRLRQMAEELERSNEELEEFARIASHDLSAPITTARWLTDLLTSRHSQQLDQEGQTCLRQISTSLERMSDLIEAVLAHALAGKGAIAAQEETDAAAALSAAMENLRKDIATSGAVIESSALPKLRVRPQALTQLFQNLLSNAIKYRRPNEPPHVQISAVQDMHQWTIEVRDNGVGIEPEWFERIFLPMQRRSSRVKGSGIGLATCKKIVNRAGGDIWVESELGHGSAFYVSLPDGQR